MENNDDQQAADHGAGSGKCAGAGENWGVVGMKEGWEILSLADICEFQRGLTYSKGDEAEFSGNVVLRANNVDLLTNQLDFSELKYISDQIQIPSSKVLKLGSLLICTASGSKSHLGKVAFIDKDYGYAFGGFMGQITPLPSILPRFLFHALTSEAYKKFISALSDGANINNLKFDDLARFQVPVPPLPEQQQIVALLDEAFAGLATAKANAERNLQNARDIFQRHLDSLLLRCDEQWEQKELGEVCEFENGDRGENYPNKSARTATGVPFINAGHLTRQGLDMESMDFISRERFNLLGAGKVKPRDVLFCLRGSLGKHASVGDLVEGAIASSLVIIRPGPRLLAAFLLGYLGSSKCSGMIDRYKNGAAQPNLSAQSLRRFIIPAPPLEEQQRICKEFDALSTEIQRLTHIYERKLAALEELKQSLLQQAFNGEL